MNSFAIYNRVSYLSSHVVTREYSTSFFSAIKLLHPDLREPIYGIYGMVRLADEIVDTFHDFDRARLLADFRRDTFKAIEQGISLNPVLQSFQETVKKYSIDADLIRAFFDSMEMDLHKHNLNEGEFRQYIYGSAEVVGLMCLQVFCDGNKTVFDTLKAYARALGAAFQKINFLRDLQSDVEDLQRSYFPGFSKYSFNQAYKEKIEEEILSDFEMGYKGVKRLPLKARFGVYVAYRYYLALFKKMRRVDAELILKRRIRIPNHIKLAIVCKASVRNRLNMI